MYALPHRYACHGATGNNNALEKQQGCGSCIPLSVFAWACPFLTDRIPRHTSGCTRSHLLFENVVHVNRESQGGDYKSRAMPRLRQKTHTKVPQLINTNIFMFS